MLLACQKDTTLLYIIQKKEKILYDVHNMRDKIEAFTRKIRSGEHKDVTSTVPKNFITIGIGESPLGPMFVSEALHANAKTTSC